jgi:hypothetical protein
MRNPLEEWDSARNHQLIACGLESNQRNGLPLRITSKCSKNPLNVKNFWISNSKFSILCMSTFKRILNENNIKIKNKPDPALSRTSYLSNDIKKRVAKSRATIPKHIKCWENVEQCVVLLIPFLKLLICN